MTLWHHDTMEKKTRIVQISIRLPYELYKKLKIGVTQKDISINKWVMNLAKKEFGERK